VRRIALTLGVLLAASLTGNDLLHGGPGREYRNGGPGVGRSRGRETGPGH